MNYSCINFKTNVGNYNYEDASHPHAVSEVENMENEIPSAPLTTKYNEWGKIETIEDEGKHLRLDFTYGPDSERWSSTLLKNGKPVQTTLYTNNYEKVIRGDSVRECYYLDKGVMVIRENNAFKYYLTFTDNLGSILAVMDEKGDKVFEASYDAWGKQTIKLNKIGLQRGYTGHEMLNDFDIINMNGRLYDPVLGRFLSPDNFVQMPDNAQSYNRYSYCLNNPLKYTDPSGEAFVIDDATIAFTIFSVASSMMQAAATGGNVWKAGAFSLLSSAASWGIGGLFSNATATFGNELLRAGAHGLASGVLSALDGGNFASSFIAGAAASGIGSYAKGIKLDNSIMIASTTAMGSVVAWATGGDFLQGAMQGLMIGALNHAQHDGEYLMQRSERCELLPDGTYVAPYDLREVEVVGRRIFYPRMLVEKPLEGVYPELFAMVSVSLIKFVAQIFSTGYQHYNQNWENRIIEFGNNPNSQYHAFRHTDKMGIDRNIIRNKVLQDMSTLDDIPSLTSVNRFIYVSGRRIPYTVYKRYQNGREIYNVGRIHEK